MTEENKQKPEYENAKLNTRIILTVLWVALALLYIYSDIGEVIFKFTGSLVFTQSTIILPGTLVIIPVIMVVANLFIKPVVIKWINILIGLACTSVNIGVIAAEAIADEAWIYYIICGSVGIIITLLIVVESLKWPKTAAP